MGDPGEERPMETKNETYPIDSLLNGFPIFDDSNIHLVVFVLLAHSRCGLLFPPPVLVSKVLTGNEQREGGSDRTSADDSERDLVPWLVFGLPHERPNSITHGVGDQDYGVDCDAFCVT